MQTIPIVPESGGRGKIQVFLHMRTFRFLFQVDWKTHSKYLETCLSHSSSLVVIAVLGIYKQSSVSERQLSLYFYGGNWVTWKKNWKTTSNIFWHYSTDFSKIFIKMIPLCLWPFLTLVIDDLGNLGQGQILQKKRHFEARLLLNKLPTTNLAAFRLEEGMLQCRCRKRSVKFSLKTKRTSLHQTIPSDQYNCKCTTS